MTLNELSNASNLSHRFAEKGKSHEITYTTLISLILMEENHSLLSLTEKQTLLTYVAINCTID